MNAEAAHYHVVWPWSHCAIKGAGAKLGLPLQQCHNAISTRPGVPLLLKLSCIPVKWLHPFSGTRAVHASSAHLSGDHWREGVAVKPLGNLHHFFDHLVWAGQLLQSPRAACTPFFINGVFWNQSVKPPQVAMSTHMINFTLSRITHPHCQTKQTEKYPISQDISRSWLSKLMRPHWNR